MDTERADQQHRSFQEHITRGAISHFGWERVLPLYQAMEWLPRRAPVKEVLGSVALVATPALAITIYDLLVPDSHVVTVAEAQPNLVDVCRNVVGQIYIRDFEEINNKVGYQEGEDKPGSPVKGARVQWKVSGQNAGAVVTTDDRGFAEKRFDPQPCNTENGTRLLPQAEVTIPDGRTALRTINSTEGKSGIGNGNTGSANVWMQKETSASPVANPTVRPNSSPTPSAVSTSSPDNRPAPTATSVVVAPSVRPAQGIGLQQMLTNLAGDVTALFKGTDDVAKAAEPQVKQNQALEKVSVLEAKNAQLQKDLDTAKAGSAKTEEESNNRLLAVVAGIGILGAGLYGLVSFLRGRDRKIESKQTGGKISIPVELPIEVKGPDGGITVELSAKVKSTPKPAPKPADQGGGAASGGAA